ncbi:hypothetical protein [Vallitalea guaymasensis]|uniref:hypothetical protein n=1 Tax=Vallitalea guaymasensis TaxID=1185412 RepID=UPI000DE4B120|nr:hypothetical protein [Vallitalea guaymasensis]
MLYIIVICVTVFFTHKIDKAIFFVRFENNVKFVQKTVNSICFDDDYMQLIARKQRKKRVKKQVIEADEGEYEDD